MKCQSRVPSGSGSPVSSSTRPPWIDQHQLEDHRERSPRGGHARARPERVAWRSDSGRTVTGCLRTTSSASPSATSSPGWKPRERPVRIGLIGRYVALRAGLDPARAAALRCRCAGRRTAALWTYRTDPAARDRGALADLVDDWMDPAADEPHLGGHPAGDEAAGHDLAPTGSTPSTARSRWRRSSTRGALQRTPAATEATYLLMRYAFDGLGYRRFEWKCDALNEPSRQAALRLGFTYEGRFRNHLVTKGRNRDTDWFSVTDAEWPAVKRRCRPGSSRTTSTRPGSSGLRCPRCVTGWADGPAIASPSPWPTSKSRQFYVDGLAGRRRRGPGRRGDAQGGRDAVLSLWTATTSRPRSADRLAADGVAPFTIAYNTRTETEVDAVLETARSPAPTRCTAASGSGAATRLLRRPGRVPLGDRPQPQEIGRWSSVSEHHRLPAVATPASTTGAGCSASCTRGSRPAASPRASSSPADRRGGRGGQPPPGRRPLLPDARRAAGQPRRRRSDQPRPRPGRTISSIAAELASRRLRRATALELALDVPAAEDVRDFWAAVLGYEVRGDGRQVEDPGGRRHDAVVPGLRPGRGRGRSSGSTSTSWSRPRSPQERIDAALAAGGTLVTRRARARVLGAGRPARQQGLHLHARGPGTPNARLPYRILGRCVTVFPCGTTSSYSH